MHCKVPATSTTSGRSSTAILLWPSIASVLDPQLAAVQHTAVHCVDGVLCVSVVVKTDERKPAAFLLVRIPRNVHVSHVAVFLEHALQHVRRGAIRQVVHLQRYHAVGVRRSSTVTAHFCVLSPTEKNTNQRLYH